MPRGHHSVRFTGEDLPKYKNDSSDSNLPNYAAQSGSGHPGQDSGAPASPDGCHFTPAVQRLRLNEQRIKLLTSINTVVSQRAELEANRVNLSNTLDDLRRKLRRRVEECHLEKKDRMRALKQANLRLEKEKFNIVSEIEHMKRHLQKEEMHHMVHAKLLWHRLFRASSQRRTPQNTSSTRAPWRTFPTWSVAVWPETHPLDLQELSEYLCLQADNKLAAARLMRDIAELRQRVAQVETRLATELKRKRQAEMDIIRLRKELSATKSCVASLRMPPGPLRKCSKFA